ncbi:hypothetical protein HRbin29_00999 [bacterium HR29]|nr:hypothetical protein HRbin29_00999 [bacterium HR29]
MPDLRLWLKVPPRRDVARRLLPAAAVVLFALVPAVPFFTDPWLRVFFLVGLYVVLGLGLNIVVGFAGLLDLGYVAFFAAGAYLMGILTSPQSPVDLRLEFWVILPLALLLGALVGLLLGLPVLPLRGDYLAIVTLGFGEIIRILLVNLRDITGGSQGLAAIEKPPVPGWQRIDEPWQWYYVILVTAVAVAFLSARLRDARIGRAWEAIREDEDVAAAMGIDTVKYKLLAFATGAAVGSVGGVLFASYIGFINPTSFTLQVSINVLAVVIIGGMGNTWGVVFGAFILIGVPELLQFRETSDVLERLGWLRTALDAPFAALDALAPFGVWRVPEPETWGRLVADKRFIIYGALLVAVMVARPGGLFPSRRRKLEFEAPPPSEVAEPSALAAGGSQ